jgi:Rrf2 family protein
MKFTAQEEFGLRCMIQLARAGGKSLNIETIAGGEAISPAYAAKVLRLLRQKGLIVATRGQKGGYHLALPASDIRLSSIFEAVGPRLYSDDLCARYAGQGDTCVHVSDCSVRGLWTALDGVIYRFLEMCTLSELCANEGAMLRAANDHVVKLPGSVGLRSLG